MDENTENDSSPIFNLDSSKGIEIKNEKVGIDKDESAQNTLSTVSHLSKDQEEEESDQEEEEVQEKYHADKSKSNNAFKVEINVDDI